MPKKINSLWYISIIVHKETVFKWTIFGSILELSSQEKGTLTIIILLAIDRFSVYLKLLKLVL